VSRTKKVGICVYCGKHGPVTSDHVPPKCLFPPAQRQNLITVPACEKCHDEFKLDDEYFRTVLSIRADIPTTTTSEYLREKTKRALTNSRATGLRTAVLKAIGNVSVRSQAGIYLGEAKGISVDFKRLSATAERIMKGLYFHRYDTVLPDTHVVTVRFTELQRDLSAIESPEIQEIVGLLAATKPENRGGNIPQTWSVAADEDTHSTVWYVRILETVAFFGFTTPR
jgi:hypothetical protein